MTTEPDARKKQSPPFFSFGLVVALAGFFLTVFYLRRFDVFTRDYETTGWPLLLENLFRVVFLFYFTWLLAGCGWLVLGRLSRRGVDFRLGKADEFLLAFFLGGAVLTLLMLPLGLLKLFHPATALALAAPILAFSYPRMISELAAAAGLGRRLWRGCRGEIDFDHAITGLLVSAGIVLALVLLVTRGVYPGETNNDAYGIYLPYVRNVLASHSLMPNDVWYMFYSFKGAGLDFLAMLLSDCLAGQGVSLLFLFAGVAVVWSVTRRICRNQAWALLAADVALSCFPFSNKQSLEADIFPITHPAWGTFHAHHVQISVWVAVMAWMAILACEPQRDSIPWFAVFGGLAASVAIFYPVFMLFVFPMLGAQCAGHVLARDFKRARGHLLVIGVAAGALAGVLLLNYEISGMLLQDPARPLWAIANQQTYSRWCSPYLLMYLLEGSQPAVGGVNFLGFLAHGLRYWLYLFRVELFGLLWIHLSVPLTLLVALLVKQVVFRKPVKVSNLRLTVPLVVPLLMGVIVADSGAPNSVYRNYVFVCFLIPILLCGLWQAAMESFLPSPAAVRITAGLFAWAVVCVSVGFAFARDGHAPQARFPYRWRDFLGFAAGHISVREALSRGDGLWKVTEEMRKAIGPDPKVYSFAFPEFSPSVVFPGRGILVEPHQASFDADWHVAVFGNAASATAVLQRQQINYFLIDFKLRYWGGLAYSPLFDPDHLAERFDLAWQGENACLLTWHGGGTGPVPDEIVKIWRQRVVTNRTKPDTDYDGMMWRIYRNTKAIYDYNHGRRWPVFRPPDLPRVNGFE